MPVSTNIPRASSALSRFTVLDLTRVRAGPTCARQLADWGANVIKIEAPERMEGGDPIGGARHGADFQNLHRNKRSITLDLKSEAGRATLLRLVEQADVVIENYRPDVKRRLRIDYPDVKAVNPRIVYASISAYGQDGPYEKWPGFDQIAQGMGGIMSVTGLPGQGPVRAGAAVADMAAGPVRRARHHDRAARARAIRRGAICRNLAARRADFPARLPGGALADRQGSAGPGRQQSSDRVPTGVYKTSDGHINIATTGSPTWVRFCKAIGGEHLIEHPDYATNALRMKNRDVLNADIEKTLASDTCASWIERLNAAGVAAGPIYKMDEVFADKQVQHLGVATDMETPDRGTLQVIRQPFTMSRTPGTIAMPTPERGEHTDEVLTEFGFSKDEIEALKKSGAT